MLLLSWFLAVAAPADAALAAALFSFVLLMSTEATQNTGRPQLITALIAAGLLFSFLALSLVQAEPLVDPTQLTPVTVALYSALVGLVAYVGYHLHRTQSSATSTTDMELHDASALPVRYVRRTRAELDEAMNQPVDWSPLQGGGSNFQTARLHVVSPNQVAFRGTPMSIFFGGVFFVIGVGLLFAIFESVCILPFGLIFGGIGYALLRSALQPMVFDRHLQLHWIGRNPPDNPGAIIDLTTVRALQLVPEYIKGDSDSAGYHSYELNLILRDGERHHVVDHGKREKLKDDALRLGVFLGCPVWDNTGADRDEVIVIEPDGSDRSGG